MPNHANLEELFQHAADLGLEGVVAKRADSAYVAGRSRDWLKIKTAAGRRGGARAIQ
jgi:ATP-dependent DNA ligase